MENKSTLATRIEGQFTAKTQTHTLHLISVNQYHHFNVFFYLDILFSLLMQKEQRAKVEQIVAQSFSKN